MNCHDIGNEMILTLIDKILAMSVSTIGQFCSNTSSFHLKFAYFSSIRFGVDKNFDQHSDANNGAIGENIMKRLPKVRSY